MNSIESQENELFLRCGGQPYKGFLCMTLRTGVIIIAIIDIGIGCLSGWILGYTMLHYELFYQVHLFMQMRQLLLVSGGFMALIGIIAILKADYSKLQYYSQYKIIEFFILCFLRSVEYAYCDDLDLCGWPYLISAWIGTIISFIYTKTVWSANVRLRNSETLMVMHGKAAVEMMEQRRLFGFQPVYGAPRNPSQFNQSLISEA